MGGRNWNLRRFHLGTGLWAMACGQARPNARQLICVWIHAEWDIKSRNRSPRSGEKAVNKFQNLGIVRKRIHKATNLLDWPKPGRGHGLHRWNKNESPFFHWIYHLKDKNRHMWVSQQSRESGKKTKSCIRQNLSSSRLCARVSPSICSSKFVLESNITSLKAPKYRNRKKQGGSQIDTNSIK